MNTIPYNSTPTSSPTAIPYIARPDKLTVILNGETLTCMNDNPKYNEVKAALDAGDADTILTIMKPIKKIEVAVEGSEFICDGSSVTYKGEEVVMSIAQRMIWMIDNGFDVKPLQNFYKNLLLNPSYRAVQELYGFLEACDLPITSDGFFLAYKKVRENFFDIHSNTMDNSPGKVLEVRRNQVDENSEQTCSYGLHVCSQSYLPNFGSNTSSTDKIVMVKVNPADVVAVPKDYNNAKMRVCKYQVIEEVKTGDIPKFWVPEEESDDTQEEVQVESGSTSKPLRDIKGRFIKADDWNTNYGYQPVADDVMVEVEFADDGCTEVDLAIAWYWGQDYSDIVRWKFA